MKTFFFTVFCALSLTSFASHDKVYRDVLISKLGYQNDQKIKVACQKINDQLQKRLENAILNNHLNEYQLAGEAIYSVKRNLHGRGNNQQYKHSCELYLRLTSDNHHFTINTSVTSFTGRGKLAACKNQQLEIEQDSSVLYSSIEDGLFSCKVYPIIKLELL